MFQSIELYASGVAQHSAHTPPSASISATTLGERVLGESRAAVHVSEVVCGCSKLCIFDCRNGFGESLPFHSVLPIFLATYRSTSCHMEILELRKLLLPGIGN